MNDASAKLCTAVLESGVHCTPEYPHCIDEARCRTNDRCFWRGFHHLADDKYRKQQASAQKDLFVS